MMNLKPKQMNMLYCSGLSAVLQFKPARMLYKQGGPERSSAELREKKDNTQKNKEVIAKSMGVEAEKGLRLNQEREKVGAKLLETESRRSVLTQNLGMAQEGLNETQRIQGNANELLRQAQLGIDGRPIAESDLTQQQRQQRQEVERYRQAVEQTRKAVDDARVFLIYVLDEIKITDDQSKTLTAQVDALDKRFQESKKNHQELSRTLIALDDVIKQLEAEHALALAREGVDKKKETAKKQKVMLRRIEELTDELNQYSDVMDMPQEERDVFVRELNALSTEMERAEADYGTQVDARLSLLEGRVVRVLTQDDQIRNMQRELEGYKGEKGTTLVALNVREGAGVNTSRVGSTIPKGQIVEYIKAPNVVKGSGDNKEVWIQLADANGRPTGKFVAKEYHGETYLA